MNSLYSWYSELIKPPFAPPAWIFGLVWTILYIIIIATFGYVFYLLITKKIKFSIALPFILNIIFNLAFTPIQFGLKNLTLASLDVLLVLITLAWALIGIKKVSPIIAYLNIPYFLWVCFATVLQISVTYLNFR